MSRWFALAALAAACQGQAPPGAGSGSAPGDAPRGPVDATEAVVVADAGEADARSKPLDPDPEPPDPGRVIADLGAIPAWQAVVDRAQLLGRRGQHGVVYGRVGPTVTLPAESPYVWLIDDTEGNGSLGVRVALGDRAKLGDRVALGGAWLLDDQRRWYWKPDSVQPLPPAPVSELKEPQPAVPGHAIVNGELASGARTMSVGRDGDLVYFQLVGPVPASDGDGWQVADQLGSPTVAVMNLPGERASYGGQDMRAADERWQLKRGQTYWVRIGKLRKRGADKPPLVNARTAPVRVL
ncbi:MAG TPA: hypothetical protein VGC42_21090 [Kofleriaceae bacterium]